MKTFERDTGTGVSNFFINRVMTALAAAENTEPVRLTPCLFDVVDPDALEQLLQSGDEKTRVTFTYRDYVVEVWGDGTINVTEAPGGE